MSSPISLRAGSPRPAVLIVATAQNERAAQSGSIDDPVGDVHAVGRYNVHDANSVGAQLLGEERRCATACGVGVEADSDSRWDVALFDLTLELVDHVAMTRGCAKHGNRSDSVARKDECVRYAFGDHERQISTGCSDSLCPGKSWIRSEPAEWIPVLLSGAGGIDEASLKVGDVADPIECRKDGGGVSRGESSLSGQEPTSGVGSDAVGGEYVVGEPTVVKPRSNV